MENLEQTCHSALALSQTSVSVCTSKGWSETASQCRNLPVNVYLTPKQRSTGGLYIHVHSCGWTWAKRSFLNTRKLCRLCCNTCLKVHLSVVVNRQFITDMWGKVWNFSTKKLSEMWSWRVWLGSRIFEIRQMLIYWGISLLQDVQKFIFTDYRPCYNCRSYTHSNTTPGMSLTWTNMDLVYLYED